MYIKKDMELKLEKGRAKIAKALKDNNNFTLMSTGITGDDARLAKAVTDAGVKILEPNHPALALARGYKGVTEMGEAEKLRHEITIAQMAEVTHGVRSVVPDDVFITVGFPGSFTELMPVIVTDEDFRTISLAGADSIHTHKSDLMDIEEWVKTAHRFGLNVDAYIGKSTDLHQFGVLADSPEEVAKVAKRLEEIGVDFIGLMTGMSYEGVAAGEIPNEIKERLQALVETVKVPTLAEGGINLENFSAFKSTGVNIVTVGTAMDDMARMAVAEAARKFMSI